MPSFSLFQSSIMREQKWNFWGMIWLLCCFTCLRISLVITSTELWCGLSKSQFFLFFVLSVLALIEMATHQPNWCLISGRVGGGMGDNLKIWQCWKMKTLSYPQLYKHSLIFFGDGCLIILSINPVHSEKPIFFCIMVSDSGIWS